MIRTNRESGRARGASRGNRTTHAHVHGGHLAPHCLYTFTQRRPRDVLGVLELQSEIVLERAASLDPGWLPTRLIALQDELSRKRRDLVAQWEMRNTVVTVGGNFLLDEGFAGSAYTAAWFMGLVNNAGFTAIAAGDTMASHAGWTEFAGISNATRPALAFSAASARSKATSSPAVFNVNATGVVYGAFFTTVSTISGTTGTLYSAGQFSGGTQSVANTDTLSVSASQAV